MGFRYCPKCKEIVDVKVVGGYSQVEFNGVPAKRRKVMHREKDGGCGHKWSTLEFPEEFLLESSGDDNKSVKGDT